MERPEPSPEPAEGTAGPPDEPGDPRDADLQPETPLRERATPGFRPPAPPVPPESRRRPFDPPWRRAKQGLLRFWRTEDRFLAAVRDVGVAALIVLLVMGGIWGYTGQSFPSQAPIVVVESGSMMHDEAEVGYGRLGTIDPGDLILVKEVAGPRDVRTYFEASAPEHYGKPGDVIIYRPSGRLDVTPIIHRAMLWVEVIQQPSGGRCYTYTLGDGPPQECQDAATIPEIGLSGYRPSHSGFITKGDNPVTNVRADQASGGVFPHPVKPEWIVGKARGEIPWFGLIKLALYGNPSAAGSLGWCHVLAATAPCDLWTMLYVSVGLLILTPIVIDAAVHLQRKRKAGPG